MFVVYNSSSSVHFSARQKKPETTAFMMQALLSTSFFFCLRLMALPSRHRWLAMALTAAAETPFVKGLPGVR